MARKYYKDIDGNPYVLRKIVGGEWHLAELCRHYGQEKGFHFGFYFTMIPKEGDLIETKYKDVFINIVIN